MAEAFPGNSEWLEQVTEPIVDPERPIVDPHHHLWERSGSTYVLEELWGDTSSGHNVVKTVFVECRASYREDGPEHLKPVGETVFVEGLASASRTTDGAGTLGHPPIAGIVAHADLRRPIAELDELLAQRGKDCFAASATTAPEIPISTHFTIKVERRTASMRETSSITASLGSASEATRTRRGIIITRIRTSETWPKRCLERP